MKKALLFLGISLAVLDLTTPFRTLAASDEVSFRALPASEQVSTSGSEFVELLAQGNFGEAAGHYDAAMRAALPEPKLRETWQALEKQAGHFKSRTQTRSLKFGGYDIALVTCEFEHASLVVKVVFNAQGEVSGLFFLPNTTRANSSAPAALVRTDTFREEAFTVGDGEWRLPGTITIPVGQGTGPWPAVVLVHGSGPNDRDETVGPLKPFRDLAWGLAAKGIVVLRYEKRTKEYAAKFGELMAAGKMADPVREEAIDDALGAVAQLRKREMIDPKRIFVLGHSLGGTIAPRLGQADPQIAGLIIMAGATRPLEDIVVEQIRYVLSLHGEASKQEQETAQEMEAQAARIKKLTAADISSPEMFLGASAAYWLDLRAHDPVAEAKTLKQALLILQGGRDYQVSPANFDDWKKGLSDSPNVTFKLYPQLNHLFVAGEGPSSPEEYGKAGHLAEPVIADIAAWILQTR